MVFKDLKQVVGNPFQICVDDVLLDNISNSLIRVEYPALAGRKRFSHCVISLLLG